MDVNNFNGVILEFGHVPSSQNYGLIVSDAQTIEGYSSSGQGNQIRHRVPLTEKAADAWWDIFNCVNQWKSARLHYRGESFPPDRDHRRVLYCYVSRCMSENKEDYCAQGNWIGCRLIDKGRWLPSKYGGFGEFVEEQGFRPNKGRIVSSVKQDLDSCWICPALNVEKITSQIDALPDLINLSNSDSKWVIDYDRDPFSNSKKAIGIKYNAESNRASQIDMDENDDNRFSPIPLEYKILILSDDEWSECANAEEVSKLNELGKMGWRLVTVIHSDRNWHCVFGRESENAGDVME